ncbi:MULTISPECIES: hypothetical protein [Streptomyces]|uniref:hypothetical protein n=1 Tax=Streptomyces TaxID=1883 RepID=UPI000A3C8D58|nr:hypothetical protein [Streptomyces viridochromogenes]
MRRRYTYSAVLSTAAATLIAVSASPAAAYEAATSCDVKIAGASVASPIQGRLIASWNWASTEQLTSLHMEAKDTYADGLHPAIRLVTKQRDGDTHNWSWHHNTKGAGTTGTLNTSATDSQGIETVRIDGGLFDGDRLVGVCYGETLRNPD